MPQNPIRQARITFALTATLTASLLLRPALAQRTLTYTEPDLHYRNGIELFEKNNYAAARYEFRQYLDRRALASPTPSLNTPGTPAADQYAVEAEYYLALTSLYADEPGAEVQVDRFVKRHSQHPKAGQLYGDLGKYYFDREDYNKAIGFLEKAVAQNASYTVQAKNKYRLALAYYNTQELNRALPLLNSIKQDADLEDAPAASYYAGVINFRQGNYGEAVNDFKRVATHPIYQAEVPNFIAQALYKQRRYAELLAYTEPLLKRSNGMHEVALFTAEVYYQQGNYAKAIPLYRQYLSGKGAPSAATFAGAPAAVRFRYGQSLFKTGAYADAINQLKPLANGKDTIAQYAAYSLGISQLQVNNVPFALTAFDQAGRLSFDKSVQEESRFNHAKLLLDQNNGGESAKELTAFQQQYPDSKFENEANELLTESYFASNNYPTAIAYIEKLKRRTAKINATYQRLTYNQAVNDFNADRYPSALINFDKSLKYPADDALQQAAQFWKAETFSAQKQYDSAIPLYAQVAKNGSEEFGAKAQYAIGYAYYNQKKYAQALPAFQGFLAKGGDPTDRTATDDARVRLADCLFATKQYTNAMQAYDDAISQNRGDRDYATYQKGVILTYVGRDSEAKAQFDQLQRQFPGSRYVDDALFQAANVDFEKGAFQVAIRSYTKLIQDKPKSYLIPAALEKRAIANANLELYEAAIADYRRILAEFGGSDRAQSALIGLQNALNDAGRPEDFQAELGKFKKANPGSTEVEKAEFENAKNIFGNGKYAQATQALLAFLQEYPNSPNTDEAQFYLAESYRLTNDAANALRYYGLVMLDNTSDFATRAATRAADLEAKAKNFSRAIANYRFVLVRATDKAGQVSAQLGLMDVFMLAAKQDSAAVLAREIIATGNVVPGAQNRAQLTLGKVALNKGDYTTAKAELDRTVALAKDLNGAEAQYLLGDILNRQKKYKESTTTLLKFNEFFDSDEFEYWKGKAFMLVADNNAALGEIVQARAVLQSVIDNSKNETIVAEAKKKLAGMKE
jgi:tetratricopeptide (TPR) repeat protein